MHLRTFSTLFIGHPFIHLDSIDSTNVYAQELLSKSNPSEGTAIFALNQTQGKGQFGRKWVSDEGQNILTSIILKPKFLFAHQSFRLNMCISMAVTELVENYIDKPVFIKWPNDIYVKNNKIAGILIENSLKSNLLENSVVGIGINVNQIQFDKSLPNPSSFRMENKQHYSPQKLVAELYNLIENNYLKLRRTKHSFEETYLQRLYQFGEKKQYLIHEKETTAIIKGIDHSGKLILSGKTQEYLLGLNEIKYL